MVETTRTSGPILPTDKGFTFIGCMILLVPALLAAGAAFAPTARGPWIASAFLLPPILFAVVRGMERRSSGYRIATALAVLPMAGILGIVAAILLPFAFVGLDTAFLWWLWIALGAALSAGIFVGLARHDPDEQKRLISRRYRPENGHLTIDAGKTGIMAMRARTGSPAIDILLKVLWWFYSGLIIVGMFLGGGAGFVLSDVLGGLLVPPPGVDMRVLIIEGVALIAIGPLGMIMPSLWRGWREVARLEKLNR